MTRIRAARSAAIAALLLCGAAVDARPPQPAPYCMDARAMSEVRQPDARTLAVMLDSGARYRVELADECPAAAVTGTAAIVARDGWVCGLNEEHVRDGERRCAVSGLARIDAEQYARLALQAQRVGGIPTLDTVSVQAGRRRGFAGSRSYCLDTRDMRGWREDGDGLVVQVAPIRTGGIREYRVELAGACPELASTTAVQLRSGIGMSAVCGNPGDRVELVPHEAPAGAFMTRPDQYGIAARHGCAIALVYPLLSDERVAAPAR